MDNLKYKKKYLKYKLKYLNFKKMFGGSSYSPKRKSEITTSLDSLTKNFESSLRNYSSSSSPGTPSKSTPSSPSKSTPSSPSKFTPSSPSKFTPALYFTEHMKQNKKTKERTNLFEDLIKQPAEGKPQTRTNTYNSLIELVDFYYRYSTHTLDFKIVDKIELLSDMRHDMSSNERKDRIKNGSIKKFEKEFTSQSLLDTLIKKIDKHLIKNIDYHELSKIYQNYGKTLDNTKNFSLDELCNTLTDDNSIKLDASDESEIGIAANLKKYRYNTNYIICGKPVFELNTSPNLHTKDTGAADGIIGNNAILSELDGLNKLKTKEE